LFIKFYTLQGQLLEQFTISGESGTAWYDIGKYNAAIVVARVTGDGENLFTQKVIVTK
jgi:hypothetical protein